MPQRLFFRVIFLISIFSIDLSSSTEEGIYNFLFTNEPNTTEQSIVKTLYANSKISVVIDCKSDDHQNEIRVQWRLSEPPCYLMEEVPREIMVPIQSKPFDSPCVDNHIVLPFYVAKGPDTAKNSTNKTSENQSGLIYVTLADKIYNFTLSIESRKKTAFNASTRVKMEGPNGYLDAGEYPLLPFYLIMCLVYVTYGIVWLTVSFLQWRDLLRIQFWIGGVIMLGMLEKAIFYAEKQSINSNGYSVPEAEIAAEIVSCTKRTLARMLVIIMSLGFGIVKPRLGPMLHRVVGVGALYFILAVVDSVLKVKNISEQNDAALVSRIPVAVLDSGICWWIFTSLVQTTRTLRLRRNTVKLNLYRHFTNTLIFSVLISVMFMLYTIATRNEWNCTPGWENKWFDEAFWHILFSVLLLVIMILWRPTNNNQRYAFTPLLDNPEDEDDDDEEDQFVSDVYAIKKRSNNDSRPLSKVSTTEEDDLRWVEENIPSAMAEPALPILDSDEEIINTKFEVSKMQ